MSSPATQPVESDLWMPKPQEGETWAGHTIHTHYFGFNVPEAAIGCFIYIRYMPVFNLCSGGVCIFQGLENKTALDIEHCNYIYTMPYPQVAEGNVIETANGLRVEFIELGKKIRVSYKSADGQTHFDMIQTAKTPLLPRGHVMPGEDKDTDPKQKPGGSEQYMTSLGDLTLNGKHYPIDCVSIRDRSFRQVRTEDEVDYPPVAWSPIYFGEDLVFNQVGYDSTQNWKGLFKIDPEKPIYFFSWIISGGEVREVVDVKRDIIRYHPNIYGVAEQRIMAKDSKGKEYHFHGEVIAMAHLPSWPNGIFIDAIYKWTDEDTGRVAYCTYQEAWYAKNQRFMKGKVSAEGKFIA
jgi:hypothetical protein